MNKIISFETCKIVWTGSSQYFKRYLSIQSSTLVISLFFWIVRVNLSTNSVYPSWKGLKNQEFQPIFSTKESHTSTTHSFFKAPMGIQGGEMNTESNILISLILPNSHFFKYLHREHTFIIQKNPSFLDIPP